MKIGPLVKLVCVAIVIVFIILSLPYIPIFEIEDIRVLGIEAIPTSVLDVIKPLYGENRFSISFKKTERNLEELPGIEKAKIRYRFPRLLVVELEMEKSSSLLFDSENYYLLSGNNIVSLPAEDAKSLSEEYCITEINPAFRRYLEKYGATPEFLEIISLVEELRSEKGNLITKVCYLESTLTPYGQLELVLGNLFSTIFVRERVSKSRISDSIKVIEKEVGSDPALIITRQMVVYDLYKDALVRRKVGSV